MAEAPVARPLGEADLAHELRSCPARAGRDRLERLERRLRLLELAQPRAQLPQRRVVEARADPARVAEHAVAVVAHEQRSELRARSLRRREPADHELLLGVALQLQPVARAAAVVRAVGTLGDHSLEALLARLAVDLLAVLAVAVRVEADRVGEPERAPQAELALAQRERPEVVALVPREVEDVQEHGHAHARALLEAGEARDAAVEGDDLAVDDEVARGLALERPYELGELVVHPARRARHEAHAGAVPDGQ